MDLKNHCLFCLEGIVPYIVVPPSRDEGDDMDGEDIEGLPPDFQRLCTYLKISLPKKESTKSILPSSCDKLLCIYCFGMADQLDKMERAGAPWEIRKGMIGETLGRIREVILAHDISADLSSSKRMRSEFEKKLEGCGIGRREDYDCLEFVEMFQTAVKSMDLEGSDSEQDSREELTATDKPSSTLKKDRKKEVTSERDNPVNENNVEIGEVGMRIEVDEEDRGSIEGEEVADFHSDMGDLDSPYCPSDTSSSSMESEGESNDDEDWKADIMTQPTDKRTNAKRQCQSSNETSSISGRTRKGLRGTSIKPSPKKKLKEDKVDEPIPQFKCAECDLHFTTLSKRHKHRIKSHPRIPRKLSTFKSLQSSIPQAPKKPGLRHCIRICTVCGQHVTDRRPTTLLKYMEHMLSHDEQSSSEATGSFSCTECDKQFSLKINLDLHVACVHEARLQDIRCSLCRVNINNYETREELIEHLKSAHGGDTVYSCKHCPMSYVSFEKLLLHMNKHRGCKKLLCPECDAECTTVQDLDEHCFQAHPQLKEKYNCERCDKSYLKRHLLIQHIDLKHGFDRKSKNIKEDPANDIACPHCESKGKIRMYKTELALQRHISGVHERRRNHKCNQCENEDRFFESKSALRTHVESFHEKIQYPCPHCPKFYSRQIYLNHHLKAHTGEGLLICEICSKGYQTMSILKRHMDMAHATVENSQQIVCEECGKEFLGEYRLTKHKKKAHPKVHLLCPICGRQFSSPRNVNLHIKRKHADSVTKPFQCVICRKYFRDKGSLKTHLMSLHDLKGAEVEEKLNQGIAQGDS